MVVQIKQLSVSLGHIHAHWSVVSNSDLMEKEVGNTVAEPEEMKNISVSIALVTLPVFEDLGK